MENQDDFSRNSRTGAAENIFRKSLDQPPIREMESMQILALMIIVVGLAVAELLRAVLDGIDRDRRPRQTRTTAFGAHKQ